jgi:dTDP-4-amino-4,6-dideoxygalactose transaminase
MATAGAVSLTGARPVFCDVDPDTFTLDPSKLAACLTPRTKAVQVVHLYGHPGDMGPILNFAKDHKLRVIEDCAQATGAEYHGKKVGILGDAGCFSFYPSKNLGGVGDGGMLITGSSEIAARVRRLRDHGSSRKYVHDELGTNSRLDEIQAAVLRIKLRHLDRWNDARRGVAAHYAAGLAGLSLDHDGLQIPLERPGCRHVYHQYTIKSKRRDSLQKWLGEQGIGAIVYYPRALHLQNVYRDLGYKPGDFPVTEAVQEQVLSLPMYPELQAQQIDEVVQAVHRFQKTSVAQVG